MPGGRDRWAICVTIVSSACTAKAPVPADGADGVMGSLMASILLVHIPTAASTLSSDARDKHVAKRLSIERDLLLVGAHVSA
jgi:hypothetical protein